MPVKTEQLPHKGGFIISEGNGHISREVVTIKAGSVLRPGELLGKFTSTGDVGKYKPWTPGAANGTQTNCAIAIDHVDASEGDRETTVIARMAEVNGYHLTLPVSGTLSAAQANFADINIVIRGGE